jgi:enoyl-[acyl-carrier protein] reductase I
MGEINKLAEICGNAPVIAATVTSTDDLVNLFTKGHGSFGGRVDFILHSAAMGKNVRKGNPYTDLNYDLNHKTFDISSIHYTAYCRQPIKWMQ